MKTKVFNYNIVEKRDIEALTEFKDHRRLRVFYEKGCKCVNCDRQGTHLILGEGRGQLHWDVYCEDGIPMSVDHIHPRSKGGSDDMSNLQPMCIICNNKKGNGEPRYKSDPNSCIGHFCNWPRDKPGYGVKKNNLRKAVVFEVGMEVWRKIDQSKVKYMGRISKIVTNPHTGQPSYMIEGNDVSMYSFTKTYVKNN